MARLISCTILQVVAMRFLNSFIHSSTRLRGILPILRSVRNLGSIVVLVLRRSPWRVRRFRLG